ncbi:ATP-binding cassette domain-containing protein [Leeuwenhoekiella sp. MAR_2009_132]|uniref:ATP-binding cassette domain-containing protein n=1 Tax=Leeuwenhoekiella sp. MAR_2009_132 TaxID=1392489 RepID=UPI00068A130B|nr:ATP-binding cassette domain-containing protein [Leeuwenhoekiella sp. MAR_2009_132]
MTKFKTKTRTHYALDVSQTNVSKKDVIKLASLDWLIKEAGETGLIFSESTLNYYLDEEYRHSKKILTAYNDSLLTKSTGERKKLLLNYQLKQNPDFLILDNPFDALDVDTVIWFKEKLKQLSESTTLIQLYKRSKDVLPFIITSIVLKEGNFIKTTFQKEDSYNVELLPAGDFPMSLNDFSNIPQSLIRFEKVYVDFNEKPVLKDITWEIKKGESWHLKGPNGAGKTTLLSMITGDSTKGYGKDLYIFDRKKGTGESVWEIKQKIGFFTTHMTERFEGMHTVIEMILSGFYDSVGLYKKPTTLEIKIAQDWLSFMNIEFLKEKRFRDLDEAHKRMVLIARAMIKHPPLLILDEPTSALNAIGAARVVQLLNKIITSGKTAVIFVSHRTEAQLNLSHTFELIKTASGSRGFIS